MNITAFIHWTISPELIESPIAIRYYGLFWAISFILGYYILKKILSHEKLPVEWADKALIYVMIGAILGARLGHVFFYDWDYYSKHLVEILNLRQGGLASHGGAIGSLIALWLLSKRITKKPFLWVVDRVVITVALAGFLIRMGNLFNHELEGTTTDVAWAFIFHYGEDLQPRHPVVLYEGLFYLASFFLLYFAYYKTSFKNKLGKLTGVFFVCIFGARIFCEQFKEHLVYEEGLDMGQILSIPFVLIGLFLILRKVKDQTA
jgi:phosphatidylglycerol:prolipoprotein diacylglycerol transferase